VHPRRQGEAGEQQSARDAATTVAPAPVFLAETGTRSAIVPAAVAVAWRHAGGRQFDAIVVGHEGI